MAKAPVRKPAAHTAPAAETPLVAAPPPAEPAPRHIVYPAGIDVDGKTLRVRAVSPGGRRRAGRAFGQEPVELEADDLGEEAIAALLGDPQLVVEIV